MLESLVLFESVINSRWFLRTSIILFLNKIDVFKHKLPKVWPLPTLFMAVANLVDADRFEQVPLRRYFPEYAGGSNINMAAKFILWKFMQVNRARLCVYPQYVCFFRSFTSFADIVVSLTQATETTNIRPVFAAIKETILQNTLKNSRIL